MVPSATQDDHGGMTANAQTRLPEPQNEENRDTCADLHVVEAMRDAERLFRSRDYVRAQTVLMSILKTDPTQRAAHHLLGRTLHRRGLYSEAELVFRWLVDGDPSDADATQGLGFALDELGRVDEAIASLERALSLRPDLPGASRKLNLLRARSRHAAATPARRQSA
jgi:Flp pilus assembly protein TadD